MHHPAAALDAATDYEWPACTAGPEQGPGSHRLWVDEIGRQACRPCEDKTRARLADLPALFAQINSSAALMRGARRGGAPTSGSRTPPIPPRLEVLSLAAAGGVATRLQALEDAWRESLGWSVAPWRGSPGEAVPEHVKFLINNLPWACDRYDSIGQDVEEIRSLHAECTAALSHDRRPGRVSIGLCPVQLEDGPCATQLTASTASPRVRCGTCGTEWADMAAWRELRQAQEGASTGDEVAA